MAAIADGVAAGADGLEHVSFWTEDSVASPADLIRLIADRRTVIGLATMEPRYFLSAPTLGAIDMPLSFSTTMMSRPESPALFSASYGRPHVIAPSPTTATTSNSSPFRSRAVAIP